MSDLQQFLERINGFIGDVLLPVVFALALLFFIFNVFRYFIAGESDTDKKETAKRLALYGIAGFVFMLTIWGIVNMIIFGVGIGQEASLQPDYIENVGDGNVPFPNPGTVPTPNSNPFAPGNVPTPTPNPLNNPNQGGAPTIISI